jgi:hypothetical protein
MLIILLIASAALAKAQTVTNLSRSSAIALTIRGFHQELQKLEGVYPELDGLSKTTPGTNRLTFANGEIKGTKKEITSYSHRNACLLELVICDRKGLDNGTISQREMANSETQIGEIWTLIVNPEGDRAAEFRNAVEEIQLRWMSRLDRQLKDMETVPISVGFSTNGFTPADWGPAYAPGMEHGPASLEHSEAMSKAQAFMAQQKFADQYAKRACAVGGPNMDVHFALLEDKTGRTHGIVRVNMATGACTWMGNNKP